MAQFGHGRHETPHRRALYCSLIDPISPFRGTPYTCRQPDLADCDYLPYEADHPLHPRTQATDDLEHFLDPDAYISSKVEQAIDRLRGSLSIHGRKPGIVIKAFYDLNIVFFSGKLRDLNTISWHSPTWWNLHTRSQNGYSFLGLTQNLDHRTAAIYLNSWTNPLNTPDAEKAMWSVVVHEMVVS